MKDALIVSAGQVPGIGADAEECIAPGQVLIVPVRLFTTPKSEGVGDGGVGGAWADDAPGDGACFNVGLRVVDSKGVAQSLQIGLRCRKMTQSFVITYIDHDSSVASAAAVRPWEKCPEPAGCPVLLSLSGVGVNEMNQADSHKYIPKGEQHAIPESGRFTDSQKVNNMQSQRAADLQTPKRRTTRNPRERQIYKLPKGEQHAIPESGRYIIICRCSCEHAQADNSFDALQGVAKNSSLGTRLPGF